MKKAYKQLFENEEYKRQSAETNAKNLQAKLDRIEAEKKKRYNCAIFCSNCGWVSEVSVAPGVHIQESDCLHCRVRSTRIAPTVFLAVQWPGKI